ARRPPRPGVAISARSIQPRTARDVPGIERADAWGTLGGTTGGRRGRRLRGRGVEVRAEHGAERVLGVVVVGVAVVGVAVVGIVVLGIAVAGIGLSGPAGGGIQILQLGA